MAPVVNAAGAFFIGLDSESGRERFPIAEVQRLHRCHG